MSLYKEQLDPRQSRGKWRKWAKNQFNRWLRRQSKKDPTHPGQREYKGYD